ncbi:hypothetical protein ZWY2020_012161 [Hordeum vulgare]|nr:hypothetical protein ZWY2020_012161 [Hordeum vulgare]
MCVVKRGGGNWGGYTVDQCQQRARAAAVTSPPPPVLYGEKQQEEETKCYGKEKEPGGEGPEREAGRC